MTRREFLLALGAIPLAHAAGSDELGPTLPLRPFANEKVTCLALGGFHIGWTTEELAQATIEAALEEGIRFFDTAASYGPGTSEERFGRYLVPKYRDRIFLMSKTHARTAAEARADLEGSLARLRTDRLDLWQLHALASPEDARTRLEQGVLDAALEAVAEGKVRHLGFTGHADPAALLRMLEESDTAFAACQFPVNPADAASTHSFTRLVLPRAVELGLAPIAMKSLADGRFFAEKRMNDRTAWRTDDPLVPDVMSTRDATLFALSMPVASLAIGCENPALVREKCAFAREQLSLSEDDRRLLIERAARFAPAVEYYKAGNLRG